MDFGNDYLDSTQVLGFTPKLDDRMAFLSTPALPSLSSVMTPATNMLAGMSGGNIAHPSGIPLGALSSITAAASGGIPPVASPTMGSLPHNNSFIFNSHNFGTPKFGDFSFQTPKLSDIGFTPRMETMRRNGSVLSNLGGQTGVSGNQAQMMNIQAGMGVGFTPRLEEMMAAAAASPYASPNVNNMNMISVMVDAENVNANQQQQQLAANTDGDIAEDSEHDDEDPSDDDNDSLVTSTISLSHDEDDADGDRRRKKHRRTASGSNDPTSKKAKIGVSNTISAALSSKSSGDKEASTQPQTKTRAPATEINANELGDLKGTTAMQARRMSASEREIVLMKRKLRNRQSAKRSRLRRQLTVAELNEEYASLLDMAMSLKESTEKLAQENMELRKENARLLAGGK